MPRPLFLPHPASTAWPGHWLALMLLLAFAWQAAHAADAELAEYQIKAAFLCKFGQYVEWPPEGLGGAEQPFVIGVMATPAVGDELALAARGLTVHGRPILVRRTDRVGELVEGVAIVYIARSHAGRAAEVIGVLKDRPVLTVTELDGEQPGSGIVNFVVVDDKVRFDISLTAATRSRLRISARLLGVARHVAGRAAA
jgi:hypothetical protein